MGINGVNWYLEENMEDQQYWSRLNAALGQFCLEEMKEMQGEGNTLVNSAVGSELEWCGSQTLLFMTADLFVSHNKIMEQESSIKALQTRLLHEDNTQALLKKQLKEVSTAAEDTSWALQEKVTRMNAQNETLLEVQMKQHIKLKEYQELGSGGVPHAEMHRLEENLLEARKRIAVLESDLAAKQEHGTLDPSPVFGRLNKENLSQNSHHHHHLLQDRGASSMNSHRLV